MCFNSRNIVLHELIGLKVRVLRSTDAKQRGLQGRVVDETKNTLLLETRKGRKSVIKKTSLFRFYAEDSSFDVEGAEINFRPYERIEKSMKFYKRRR